MTPFTKIALLLFITTLTVSDITLWLKVYQLQDDKAELAQTLRGDLSEHLDWIIGKQARAEAKDFMYETVHEVVFKDLRRYADQLVEEYLDKSIAARETLVREITTLNAEVKAYMEDVAELQEKCGICGDQDPYCTGSTALISETVQRENTTAILPDRYVDTVNAEAE